RPSSDSPLWRPVTGVMLCMVPGALLSKVSSWLLVESAKTVLSTVRSSRASMVGRRRRLAEGDGDCGCLFIQPDVNMMHVPSERTGQKRARGSGARHTDGLELASFGPAGRARAGRKADARGGRTLEFSRGHKRFNPSRTPACRFSTQAVHFPGTAGANQPAHDGTGRRPGTSRGRRKAIEP